MAGNGTAGSGLNQLNIAYSVFVDASSNVYVGDVFNYRILKWAPGASTGTIVAGDGTSGSALSQLYNPFAVWVDAAGYIYVSDVGNNRVVRWAQ